MKITTYLGGLAILLAATTVNAADATPQTEQEKFSYAIGFQIGQSLKRENMDLNLDSLSQAIGDVLQDKPVKMPMNDMRAAVEAFQKKQLAARESNSAKAKQEGTAFLAANKTKPGVISLPSGVQYKVLASGKGKQPSATSNITAHYRGTLINGKEFDSSYKRGEPASFGVNQVIKGWQEILPMMHEGDKWQVVIPAELAYGEHGAGASIGPNETLVFEIELLKVN